MLASPVSLPNDSERSPLPVRLRALITGTEVQANRHLGRLVVLPPAQPSAIPQPLSQSPSQVQLTFLINPPKNVTTSPNTSLVHHH